MEPKVTTNNHWREFYLRSDVPEKVLESEFEHLSEDDCTGFIKYRGWWMHVSEFMLCGRNSPFWEWHGYTSDTYFSGIVIKLSEDCERYQIGMYYAG